MKIITAAVIKGGTGKTTTIAALAQAGTAAGKRILAIDLDPQGNLTAALAGNPQRPGSYELLEGTATARQATQTPLQGMDCMAASPNLAAVQTRPGSARRLQRALDPVKEDYDLILIDTPPQMGEMTFNALQAATGLIIPLETDTGSLQGLYNVTDLYRAIKGSNPELSFTGIVITRYDSRTKLNRYLRDTIRNQAEASGIPYLGEIRAGIAVREAQATRSSLFDYAPNAKPAQDYRELFRKIIEEA